MAGISISIDAVPAHMVHGDLVKAYDELLTRHGSRYDAIRGELETVLTAFDGSGLSVGPVEQDGAEVTVTITAAPDLITLARKCRDMGLI